MKHLLWLFKWILKAAIFFTLLAFALNNQHEASVHFFFGTQWRAPQVLIVLAALTLGVTTSRVRPTVPRGAAMSEPNDLERLRALDLEGLKTSLKNLRTFPCIKSLEATGKVALHGSYFDIASGTLSILNQLTGEYYEL